MQTFANRVGTCANAGLLLAGDTGPDHVLRWFEAYATALDTGYFQVGCRAPACPDESSPVSTACMLHAATQLKDFWICISMQLISCSTLSIGNDPSCLAISRLAAQLPTLCPYPAPLVLMDGNCSFPSVCCDTGRWATGGIL